MMILGHELGHFAHRDHLRSRVKEIKKLIEQNKYSFGSLSPLPETLVFKE